MRTIGVILILFLTLLEVKSRELIRQRSEVDCFDTIKDSSYDPWCGYDIDCYALARNADWIEAEECIRRELKRPGLLKVIKGKCPNDKAPCFLLPQN
nr:accessory gland protein Acp63F-like [Drosophila takahashii]